MGGLSISKYKVDQAIEETEQRLEENTRQIVEYSKRDSRGLDNYGERKYP